MIQGFSSGLIGNRELIYETDLPSFQRDFASVKTLDHGTGPAITFTRASDATYFDANGVLQTASNNVPRFDHDAATGSSLGLLIEEARTNSIRNSQAGGVAAGALPTHWTAGGTANGVTRTIIGGGTEDGLAYMDIQYSGTPTSAANVTIAFDAANQVVAANGQTWTGSCYCKLQGGSLTNVSNFRLGIDGRDAAGVSLSPQQITNLFITPTASPLRQQRISATRTMDDAAVLRAFTFLIFTYTSSSPIDLTLRIAAPQLEQGAFPTSYIPTTSAAATRSADSAVVSPVSSFYNAVEGTMFCEFVFAGLSASPDGVIWGFDDSSQAERIFQFVDNSSTPATVVTESSSTRANLVTGSAVTAGQVNKFIAALKVDDYQSARNGTLGTPDTSGAFPTGINRLRFGRRRISGSDTGFYNGHIRKVAYYPKRLSNTLLQQLTT